MARPFMLARLPQAALQEDGKIERRGHRRRGRVLWELRLEIPVHAADTGIRVLSIRYPTGIQYLSRFKMR